MIRALLYLRLVSLGNLLRSRLKRLRQPKYFIGAVVGFSYLYLFFFRPLSSSRKPAHPAANEAMEAAGMALPTDWLPTATAMGALVLLLIAVGMWLVPTQRATLGFSEAEIAFLFPAPIRRRALVHFKLLSAQFRSLVGACLMMLFSNRWSFVGGNALTHALGWWFIFSALSLHQNGASFTLTRLMDQGVGAWRRRLLVAAIVAAIFAATFLRLGSAAHLPTLNAGASLQPFADWLTLMANAAPLSWLLWPFRIIAGPFFAATPRDFLWVLAPALGLLALQYGWVVRMATAFEDASVEQSEKKAAQAAARRAGDLHSSHAPTQGRPGPFTLASVGRPELAFLWKNLLSTWPYFSFRVFSICAFLIAAAATWLSRHPSWDSLLAPIAGGTFMILGYTLIAGPQFARQDIRHDLAHADILKTYPLPGWQIILGQLLAPTVILTGIVWLAILGLAFTFRPTDMSLAWLTPQLRVVVMISFGIIAPALVMLQLLVPNAATLFFPGWSHATRVRGGGPEVMGQRMIFFFAQLLTMVFALLPAGAMGALILFILQAFAGSVWAVTVAAGFVFATLVGEVAVGVWLLGLRFEKLDLSREVRA